MLNLIAKIGVPGHRDVLRGDIGIDAQLDKDARQKTDRVGVIVQTQPMQFLFDSPDPPIGDGDRTCPRSPTRP